MKNVFIAIAVLTSLSACNTVHTNIAVDPNNTEARFCNLNCPFHGIGNDGKNATSHASAHASAAANHGASATSGGMGHSGRGTSGNGASSGAAARK